MHPTSFPHYLSASQDTWADPKNEFQSAFQASPVWKLWGKPGLTVSQQPAVSTPAQDGHVGYHGSDGRHNLELADWNWFMDFADKHLQKP